MDGLIRKKIKGQAAVEYLTTYGWAFLILAIVVVGVYFLTNSAQSAASKACVMEQGVTCQDIIIGGSPSGSNVLILMTNSQHEPVVNPSLTINPDGNGNATAACTPDVILPGGSAICNVGVTGSYVNGELISTQIYFTSTICPSANVLACTVFPPSIISGVSTSQYEGNVIVPTPVITLSAANSVEPAGSPDALQVTVTLGGTPLGGASIAYSGNVPQLSLSPQLIVSDTNGDAPGSVTSSVAGNVMVTASYGIYQANTVIDFTSPTNNPIVRLLLQSTNDPHGQSDTATGTTTASGDFVDIEYCAGTSCTPSAQLSIGTGIATYDVGVLVPGTYTLDACDITYSLCSTPTTLTVTSTPPTVSLTLQSPSDPHGQSDMATGITAISGDNVAIYYCAGTGCTPAALLSSGTDTATYDVGALVPGTYTLEACDTSIGACSITDTLTITHSTGITLALQSTSIDQGQSDTATGTTAASGDSVAIYYCAGTGCTPSTQLSTGTTTTTYNVGTLGIGTYVIDACDTTSSVCSATDTLNIAGPASFLSLQSASVHQGQSDSATGLNTESADAVVIYSCNNGPGCTPSTQLSTGTGTTTFNVGTLSVGTYVLDACDTVAGVCSSTRTLTISSALPTVTITLQSTSGTPGQTDTATGTTTTSTDATTLYYCAGSSCNPNTQLATGTGTATYNVDTLPPGLYRIDAEDVPFRIYSSITTFTISSVGTGMPPIVTLTLQSQSITSSQSDFATGTTTYNGDNIVIYYCSGASCTPSTQLSAGSTTTTYNVGTFSVGTYVLVACDTTANICSATQTLTVSSAPPTVTLTLQSTSDPQGQSDTATGTTAASGDAVAIYYSSRGHMPSTQLSTGTGTTTYNVGTITPGTYSIDACDTVSNVCSAISTLTITHVTPTLTLQSASDPQGQSDIATGTTPVSGDTVAIEYCAGSSCSPSTHLSSGTGTTTYDVGTLGAGTYVLDACDTTANTCSSRSILTLTGTPATVTLALQSPSDTQGQSDIATGTTTASGDTVDLEYCAGTSCTPSTHLSSGTGTTTYDVGTLASGTYTLYACDTTANVCSATSTLTLASTSPTVMFTLQSASTPHGQSDTATGTTTVSGDNVAIEYCAGNGCTPSTQLSTGTGTATYNVGGLIVGTYTLDACDTTFSACSAIATLTIT